MKDSLKALLIDFDGTLVNSVPLLFKAYSQFLTKLGQNPTQGEYIILNGFSPKEMVACLKTWHELEQSYDQLLDMYKDLVRKKYEEAKLYSGVRYFLRWAKQNGIRLGVVTAALGEWVEPLLKKEDLLEEFDFLITSDQYEKSKPDPECFLKGLQELSLSPKEVIAIDDSPNGIRAANEAKIEAIQFHSGGTYHGKEESAIFHGNWDQILHFIEKERLK